MSTDEGPSTSCHIRASSQLTLVAPLPLSCRPPLSGAPTCTIGTSTWPGPEALPLAPEAGALDGRACGTGCPAHGQQCVRRQAQCTCSVLMRVVAAKHAPMWQRIAMGSACPECNSACACGLCTIGHQRTRAKARLVPINGTHQQRGLRVASRRG